MHRVYYRFKDKSNNELEFKFQTADGTQVITIDNLYSFIYEEVEYTANGTTHESGTYRKREYESADGAVIKFHVTAETPLEGYWSLASNGEETTIAPFLDALLLNISAGSFTEYAVDPVTETENGNILLMDGEWRASNGTQIVIEPDTNAYNTDSEGAVIVDVARGEAIHGVRVASNKVSNVAEFGTGVVHDRGDIILFIGKSLETFATDDPSSVNIVTSLNEETYYADNDMTLSSSITGNATDGYAVADFELPTITDNQWGYEVPFLNEFKSKSHRLIGVASYEGITDYKDLSSVIVQGIATALETKTEALLANQIQASVKGVVLYLDDETEIIDQTKFNEIEDYFKDYYGKEIPIVHTQNPSLDLVQDYREQTRVENFDGVEIFNHPSFIREDPFLSDVSRLLYTDTWTIGYYTEENGWSIEVETDIDIDAPTGYDSSVITKIYITHPIRQKEGAYVFALESGADTTELWRIAEGQLVRGVPYYSQKMLTNHSGDIPVGDSTGYWELGEEALILTTGEEAPSLVRQWNEPPVNYERSFDVQGRWENIQHDEAILGTMTDKGKDLLARKWANTIRPFIIRTIALDELGVLAHYRADTGVEIQNGRVDVWRNQSAYGSTYDLVSSITRIRRGNNERIIYPTTGNPLLKKGKLYDEYDVVEFNQDQLSSLIARNNPLLGEGNNYDTSRPHLTTSIADYDMFFVLTTQEHITRNRGTLFHVSNNSGSFTRILAHYPWEDNKAYFYSEPSVTPYHPINSPDAVYNGETAIVHFQYRNGVHIKMRKNGATIASGTYAVNITAGRDTFLRIGTSKVHHQSCDIAELAIFATGISDAVVEQVEGYLAHQYGITSLLTANHPYKYVRP